MQDQYKFIYVHIFILRHVIIFSWIMFYVISYTDMYK